MSQIDERQRSINAKIERVRKRVKQAQFNATSAAEVNLCNALLGLLDLLGDEL